jgi:predicted nucleic acid-binding protein
VGIGKVVRGSADAHSGASAKAKETTAVHDDQKYDFVDAYSGASVSIDNSLAILHALFKYHAENYYKK